MTLKKEHSIIENNIALLPPKSCNQIVHKGRPCRTVFRNLKYAVKVSVKVQFNFVDMSTKSKYLYRRNGG